jgi:hypothetical protein
MFHSKKFILEIRFQQSFNSKSEWTTFLIWSQMSTLTIFLIKYSTIPYMNRNCLANLKMTRRFV